MRIPHTIIAIIGFLFVAAIIGAPPSDMRIDIRALAAFDFPPPRAEDDSYTIHTYARLLPLSNDYLPNGGSYTVITQPTHGTLNPATSSTPWYHPQTYFTGTDFFVYQICDSTGACDTATVNITVVNQRPVALDDRYTATPPYTRLGTFSTNDYDPDNDPYEVCRIVSPPTHGTLSPSNCSSPWYYPQAGYSGPDSLVYEICDTFNTCAQATVYINDDDANGGSVSCNSRVGQPINISNGNVYLEQADYQFSSGAEALNLTRTYNSNSQQTNLFGKGWFTAYDEVVKPYGSKLRLYLADGRAVDFNWSSTANAFLPVQMDVRVMITKGTGGIFTAAFKDGSVHQFSKAGKLLWLKDPNNNQTTFSYDADGRIISVTDPFGRTLTITTATSGRVISIGDSLGTVATYTYGAASELLSVTYADNSGYQFTYGAPNLALTTVRDALGNILESHTYDSNGRALTSEKQGGVERYVLNYVSATQTDVTDGLNHVTKYTADKSKGRNVVTRVEGSCGCGNAQIQTWTYDNQLNVTSKTDALTHVTSYTYDTNGNRLTEADATGTVSYTYNSLGEVLTRTDQMNGVTTNTYNAQGNLLTTRDALNNTTTFTYDTRGQLLTTTDPRNNTTTFTYDANGNLTRRTDVLNNQTNIAYDARGRVTSVTNALNQVTSYEYDLAGREKKIIYPDNNLVLFTYDLAGRRTKIKDPRGYETTFAYDAAYRLITKTNADAKVTNYAYDAMSNLTGVTDELNRTTNYTYDEFSHLTKIKYPEATAGAGRLEENFTYDSAGNLLQKTDQAGRVTSFCYDNSNRLTSTTDPALKTTTYEFNARSQQTAVVDAINQRYEFVYDALGRRTQEKKGTATMAFAYDAAGNRIQRTDYNNAVTGYAYDALNRLTTINYPDTTSATYGYDVLSRLTTATNPSGTVTIAYDNHSRVSSVTDVFGQMVSYGYDANSNRTQLSLNGGTSATYQYDVVNRLTQLTDNAGQAFTFAYDATNKLTSRTTPNGTEMTEQYDGLDRLTRLKYQQGATTLADYQYQFNTVNNITQMIDGEGTHDYTYDTVDRLTAATHPNQPNESYMFDDVDNRTASHQGSSYSYQAFNRLVSANGTSFGYDTNGNQISKSGTSGDWTYSWDYENRLKQASKSGGVVVTYAYDALGRRIKRSSSTGGIDKFVYDGADILRDLDESGATITDYLNGPGIDNKLRQTSSGIVSYFATDHLGTTRTLTDAFGNVAERIDYDSFGSGSASALTRYTYTGREFDSDTGLMYYRARWYDRQVGRFISEDPIGFGGGMNWYTYVGGNPLKWVDPTGLDDADREWENRINPASPTPNPWYWSHNESADNPPLAPPRNCGCGPQPSNPLLMAGAVAASRPNPATLIFGGLLLTYALIASPPVAVCPPDNVIPFPTPRPTPFIPPPPPPLGRKYGDELCRLRQQVGMFCEYECKDGFRFVETTDSGTKSGKCPPVAPRPAG